MKDFKGMVMGDLLEECPVTGNNIKMAQSVHDINVDGPKGKHTQLCPLTTHMS